MSSKEKVVALYDYSAQYDDELSFEKGDEIMVLAKDESPWWKGELNKKVGLFPNNYVQLKDVIESLKISDCPKEDERQQSITELITTEQTYVDDMSVVGDVFEKPLIESKLLTDKQLKTIFSNWHEILKCNFAFLRELQVRRDTSKVGIDTTIGDILCENLPSMQIYVEFCGLQTKATALLQALNKTNQEFNALTKRCESDKRAKGLPLSSFLIKPMQRITKYPLLITKVLEHTSKEHCDRQNLEKALKKAEDLCRQVNELLREKENIERLEWLQEHILSNNLSEPLTFNSQTHKAGPRRFLHSSHLTKTNSGKELMGFLMNDMLLLAQPTRPLQGQFSFEMPQYISFRIYKEPLFLTNLIIFGSVGDPRDGDFQLEYNKSVLLLTAGTHNEKGLWLKKLMKAKTELKECERKSLQRQQSKTKRRPKGMLKLIIVYGKDLEVLSLHNETYEVFCEVSIAGKESMSLPVSTPSVTNPTWESSMRFLIKDLEEDIIRVTVKSKSTFSPDKFLGYSEISISDILKAIETQGHGPIKVIMELNDVRTGEVAIVFDVRLFKYV